MFKVAFSNFWDGFDKQNNLFLEVLKDMFGDVSVIKDSDSSPVDLEIVSVFVPKNEYLFSKIRSVSILNSPSLLFDKDYARKFIIYKPKRKSRHRIWYTGENIRPPISTNFDGFLSFDLDDYENKNYYFKSEIHLILLIKVNLFLFNFI